MNEYATLAQLRAWLSISDASRDDDSRLFQYLTWASRRIDKHCYGRRFYPRSETRKYDYQRDVFELVVDDDLLAVTTLTVDGDTVSADDYMLYPLNDYPKYKIAMDRSGGEIFTYSDTPQDAVQIAATWGYHEEWNDAWPDSQDAVQDDPLSSSATTLTVANVDGANVDGIAPRFSAGNLLKIESEYLAVTDSDTSNDTVTVRRGVNGTTAASHDNGTIIYTYQPMGVVTAATLALAKWLYEIRDATGNIIALPSMEGTAMEAKVANVLADYDLPKRTESFGPTVWM